LSTNKTDFLQLHSWEPTDNVKRIEFNDNFNKIDEGLKTQSDKVVGIQKGIDDLSRMQNFGSNYVVGADTWSPENSTIDADIDELALVKPRPILLDFHVRYDSGTLKIVQFGFGSLSHSESKVDYAVNKLKEKGFTIYGIKVHPTGSSTTSYTFDAAYLTAYRTLVNQLATKYEGQVPYFLVTNEFPEVTGSATLKTNLQNIINDVKAKGFKAGISAININEIINCQVLNDLDCYGINTYPFVGTKGLTTTSDEVVSAWGRGGLLETFADLKKKYPDKETFITETGTTDKIISLENPAYWNTVAYPDNDGKIMSIYWDGTFKALKNLPQIDMVFGWDGGIYSPYQFETSLETMKKWVGEE